jgi:outer membrane receptor protein involved in Fe transport
VGSEGSAFDVPSPGIDRAEQSTTLEVGVKWSCPLLSAWVFGHYSFLKSFITRRYLWFTFDDQPAAIRVNSGDGYLAGLEAAAEWRFPRGFALRGWISWSQGDLSVEAPGKATVPMSRVAPLQGAFALTWQHRRCYWAEATLRWSTRQDRLSPTDLLDTRICPAGPDRCDGTPGFAILGVAGGMRLSRHAAVVFRLENLTNEAYKFHGSGVYAPGVSGTAELRLSL